MNIYKTTNLINGKIYIGKEEKPRKGYLGSGKLIKHSIIKYGVENFKKEIIDFSNDRFELREKEKYWIEFYNSTDLSIGYNIAKGGDGGQLLSSEKLSSIMTDLWKDPKYREKQSESRKGRISWNTGKKGIYNKASREKMALAKLNTKHSEEQKEKIRNSNYKREYVIVKCIETGEVFNSINAARRFINLPCSYKLTIIPLDTLIKLGELTFIKNKNGKL